MNLAAAHLDPPIDANRDHVLGESAAAVELVEYGDYECPHCREAHADLQRRMQEIGEPWRYAFRHLPNPRLHKGALLAAEAAEAAHAQGKFWQLHEALFASRGPLDRVSLIELARKLELDVPAFIADLDSHRYAPHVQEDVDSAIRAGAHSTPTYFLNGRRYDDAWDAAAVREAIDRPVGFRLRRASQDFAGLPASGGVLLLIGAAAAQVWANLPISRGGYDEFWSAVVTVALGSHAFEVPLRELVNEGFMALFFFVVTLEVRREVEVGQFRTARRAVLPIAAAVGGLVAPALLYAWLNAGGPGATGWGIPMSSDTAFALGLLAVLGRSVPLSLKAFVAALAVADDIGAILVVAVTRTGQLSALGLCTVAGLFAVACALRGWKVYRVLPYTILGVLLWLAAFLSGLHATIAGVLLAMAIPTRGRPAPTGLLLQSTAAFKALEAPLPGLSEEHRSEAAVKALETVVERLLSPARRLELELQPWSAYLVLPLVALANSGVAWHFTPEARLAPVGLGIILGLVVAKPLGIIATCLVLVRAGVAELPAKVTWRFLAGAACICGIGFSESMFLAETAFFGTDLLAVSKISILVGSACAGLLGWLVLRGAARRATRDPQAPPTPK